MVAGIVVTAAGGVSGLIALSAALANSTCDSVQSPYATTTTDCSTYRDITVAGLVGFGVLLGAGIPMIIVGGGRVPNEEAAQRVVLSPWASRNSGGLSLSGNF
jgi:hypothetical protein